MATYLTFTQGTPTSNKKFTFSTWLKRGDIDTDNVPFYCGSGSELDLGFMFSDAGPGNIRANWDATASKWIVTNRVFRDPAAWYHIVFAVDTSLASSGDRLRLYVNGVEETSFSAEAQPTQDSTSAALASGQLITLGRNEYSDAKYFRGVMAHTHFIDGTQYAASDFGEIDATSGIWVAKTGPSVTYGNNGFFLKYASGALGTDSSGNGNNLVVSGTMTNTKDTPDNNYTTGNPLLRKGYPGSITIANGNNTITDGGSDWTGLMSVLGVSSGKWYVEFKRETGSNSLIGVCGASQINETSYNQIIGATTFGIGLQHSGTIYVNTGGPGSSFSGSYAAGDIISVALDMDNNKVYFAKDGEWATGSGAWDSTTFDAAVGAQAVNTGDDTYVFGCSVNTASTSINFGNGYFGTTPISSAGTVSTGDDSLFEYNVPTGFYGLNTKNLGSYS